MPGIAQANSNNEKLIAIAEDLEPPPLSAPAVPPVVKTQVVQVESQEQEDTRQSVQGVPGGRVISGNNCVSCVRALTGRGQSGNAGTWGATHSTPRVGSILILRPGEQGASSAGHVAVVTGIRGNIVDVAHCNFPGKTWFYDNGSYF